MTPRRAKKKRENMTQGMSFSYKNHRPIGRKSTDIVTVDIKSGCLRDFQK
jgi:hypothetical protein